MRNERSRAVEIQKRRFVLSRQRINKNIHDPPGRQADNRVRVAMSSPSENALRELPCTRPVIASNPHLYEPNKLQSHSRLEVSKQQSSQEPWLVNTTIDMILGSGNRRRQSLGLKRLESRLDKYFREAEINAAVIENSSIKRMLAIVCLANNRELEACCHLIDSHAACLRQQILYRHLKTKLKSELIKQPAILNLDPSDLDVDHHNLNTNPKRLVSTLHELPSEWYVVQVTAEHEHLQDMRHRFQPEQFSYSLKPTHGLHVIVLPTGINAMDPICITLPKPNTDSTYDIRTEIEKLLNSNKSDLSVTYTNTSLYWKMRKKQNDQMSVAIWELEYSWLREWRILFLADYIDNLELVNDIHTMIDKLIADSAVKNISERSRWLLKKVATGACYLRPFEIERAVKYILPTQKKLAANIILSIVAKSKVMDPLKEAKRNSLVLILDECLDHLSFESMQILKYQPVTRLPSLHVLYAMFNKHKNTIKDGYKIIKETNDFGTFIVNPSLDLKHMEARMKIFLNYWLPRWKGICGSKPNLEDFKKALSDHNLLMYCGHGNGIQYLRGEEIERMQVLALVLLFGCSSIKLTPIGGRQAAFGISNQYLMASSPCILGMLWEVTDGDIDRMTTEFISKWISSSAKRAWSDVNQDKWNKGTLEFNKNSSSPKVKETNMLVAVAKSKDVCKQYMTSAAVVVRGLPVKLVNSTI